MRLLYIGYDKSCFRTRKMLSRQFGEIDFYLVAPDSELLEPDLEEFSILADHLLVPPQAQLRTEAHKQLLAVLGEEFAFLNTQIFGGYERHFREQIVAVVADDTPKSFAVDVIDELTFDKASQKIILRKKQETIEYDFLIVQNGQMVTAPLSEKSRKILAAPATQFFQLLNFEISISYKYGGNPREMPPFICIDNTHIRSVFDNWYFCHLRQNVLSVSFFADLVQSEKNEYIDFLLQRSLEKIKPRLDFLELGEVTKRFMKPVDGFYSAEAQMIFGKTCNVFPDFCFWSQSKIDAYISGHFFHKNRKKLNREQAEKDSI